MSGHTRPVLRWHGGKYRLATWIISHLPPHRIYVEPYGGAASVLMRKQRSYAEVYNDLDGDVVNLFRVLRDPVTAERLREVVKLTPWSRTEFFESYEVVEDPVERARRTVVRCFMSHGSTSRRANRTGFRAKCFRQNQTGARDWMGWPEQIPAFVERLRGVVIECRPALEVIAQQDSPATLFYIDPPYLVETRTGVKCQSDRDRAYVHDLDEPDHRELARVLHEIQGMAVVSGYPHPLYDELYAGWMRVEKDATVDGGGVRREVLWISPAAARLELFG